MESFSVWRTDELDRAADVDAALIQGPCVKTTKPTVDLCMGTVSVEEDAASFIYHNASFLAQWTRDSELVDEGDVVAMDPDGDAGGGIGLTHDHVKREHQDQRPSSGDFLDLEQMLVDDPPVPLATSHSEFPVVESKPLLSPTASNGRLETTVGTAQEQKDQRDQEQKQEQEQERDGKTREEIGMTPLEIRRKRNRESMQRARRRQRDDIENMKLTVRAMEKRFDTLSEQKDQERIHTPATTTTSVHVESQYRSLADKSRQLKEEKFLLEKMLMEKTKTVRRLQQAIVDRKAELGIASSESPDTLQLTAALSIEFFTPITEQQADAAIKRCYEDIVALEKISKPLRNTAAAAVEGAPLFPPESTFGWQMLCHLLPTGNGFFVAFTKTFAHVTPDDVMLKTWSLFSRPENNSGSENGGRGGVIRLQTLQVVNENAYVASRDVQHPSARDKTLRTVFLRFRLQTEQGGFVVGRACMNPTNAELRALEEREANVVYGDFSSWIEFRRPDGEDGVGCEVKFGAILAYDTQEDTQLRLINALMTTIMWETTIIQPVFSLQSCSSPSLA